jgi:microcystin-dependent protein
MSQPFIGQIIPVGFNFAPVGWFLCQGQLVPIAEFSVLFNLIGTTYGGDGISTFGIPNLCGRVPLHQGQGQGLSPYPLGQTVGSESITLLASNLPAHTHPFRASGNSATSTTPGTGAALSALGTATAGAGISVYGAGAPSTTLNPRSISQAGSSQPHENHQPYQVINFIIAWAGVFPSQS